MYLANSKSDMDNEQDIYEAFLAESKGMLDSEYDQLQV